MATSYQTSARARKMAKATPIREIVMKAGASFFSSVRQHLTALTTPHNHNIAPMLAASKSNHVNCNCIPPMSVARPRLSSDGRLNHA